MADDLHSALLELVDAELSRRGVHLTRRAQAELRRLISDGYRRGSAELRTIAAWQGPIAQLADAVAVTATATLIATEGGTDEAASALLVHAGFEDGICPLWPFC